MEAIDQTVDGELLSARPRRVDHRRLAHVQRLLDHIELAQTIEGRLRRAVRQGACMSLTNGIDVTKPVVDEPELRALEDGSNAAAPVMSRDNHVLDLQHVDRVLQDREAVEIRVHDHVGDVAMNEQFAGRQSHDFVRRNAAVRAPDPQVRRRLLLAEAFEECGVVRQHALGPLGVVLQQTTERCHAASVHVALVAKQWHT